MFHLMRSSSNRRKQRETNISTSTSKKLPDFSDRQTICLDLGLPNFSNVGRHTLQHEQMQYTLIDFNRTEIFILIILNFFEFFFNFVFCSQYCRNTTLATTFIQWTYWKYLAITQDEEFSISNKNHSILSWCQYFRKVDTQYIHP